MKEIIAENQKYIKLGINTIFLLCLLNIFTLGIFRKRIYLQKKYALNLISTLLKDETN